MRFLERTVAVRIVALWLVLGSVLAVFAARVRDYIDLDAGRYERMAISIARTHSLAPRINGQNIHYVSMLYPVLLAPFFAHGAMWSDLRNAQIASAYIMASACIPAFLLTRRVTSLRSAPYLVAVLTVCMPWIVTAMSLMTEVSAYPASVWALYLMVVAVDAPSRRHDLFAVLGIALAFLARGQLITLGVVFPLAILAFEYGRASGAGRVRVAGRSIVQGHRVLAVGYLVAGSAALLLYLQDRLSSVIGIYSAYSSAGTPKWGELPRTVAEYVASFSLGVGVVPCVIALAWIGANMLRPAASREAHAFACVAGLMIAVVFVQSANFDLVVNAYIHDRFLMYLVPVMLIGTVLAVADAKRPRWSLAAPLGLVVAGFTFGTIPTVAWQRFFWFDLDTPISSVYRVLAFHLGGMTNTRVLLVAVAIGGTALFFAAAKRPTRQLAPVVFGLCAIAMVAATTRVFYQTFKAPDRNARSITTSQHGVLDWIDEAAGSGARVTVVQYPISSDWFVNQERWVDFEYFNKSISHDARIDGNDAFDYLGLWFPKLDLHFNAATGAVAESPTRWVVHSLKETRFQIAGTARAYEQGGALFEVGMPWRLAWLTSGLYDDGWTRPGVPMLLRVYPAAGQQTARKRTVTLVLRTNPEVAQRSATLSAQGQVVKATVTPTGISQPVDVCVPARGYAEVRLAVAGSSAIPGDLASHGESLLPRTGGLFVAALNEADEIGAACSI